MRSVICGGYQHQSLESCAAHHGVAVQAVEEGIYVTGRLNGLLIRFGPEPAPDGLSVVHGEPLLARGYCTHRLGVYYGGGY